MKILPAILLGPALLIAVAANAQITITAADMPVVGDTLRYSFSDALNTTVDRTQTGANFTWDFSAEVPVGQGVDTFKTAAQVNSSYAATISPTAYGYKIADSLPGAPVPVKNIYNFFNKKNSPSRYVIEGYAANIGGFPTPQNYSNEDEVYYFPLDYNDYDSSYFKFTISLFGLGSFSQEGYRKTTVDGWGTIKTPYTSTPVNVIRVRSEVNERDTVKYGGNEIGIPRNYVEYKWLANGEHYPLMFLTTNILNGNETETSVRYRDTKRSLGVAGTSPVIQDIAVFPIPAADAITLRIPAGWINYTVELFDAQGKMVEAVQNNAVINTSALPKGHYFLRLQSGASVGMAQFVR